MVTQSLFNSLPLSFSLVSVMSGWLRDGEVLEGQGSGQASPRSPRIRTPTSGRAGRPLSDSTAYRSPQDTMRKAKELFRLCDKETKGFITKRDLQVCPKCVWSQWITKYSLITVALCVCVSVCGPAVARGGASDPGAAGVCVWEFGPWQKWLPHAPRVSHRPWFVFASQCLTFLRLLM